ncbi:MAG: MBL fold metallo-hydrolase [Eubacteriales bacterium]
MALKDYVLLTANAGVLICCKNKKILVDALHNTKTFRFSRVPDELLKQIADGSGDFADVDLLLFTHDHPDHYSKTWTQRCLERNPSVQIVSPIHDFSERDNVHFLTRPKEELHIAGIEVTCRLLQHDGTEYAGLRNYAYLLDIDGTHILLLGDGAMDAKAIQSVLEGWKVNLAILNFPFLTLKRGRDIMNQVICADKYLIFHLPSIEDDINGYAAAAGRTIQKIYQNSPAIKILEEGKKGPIVFSD